MVRMRRSSELVRTCKKGLHDFISPECTLIQYGNGTSCYVDNNGDLYLFHSDVAIVAHVISNAHAAQHNAQDMPSSTLRQEPPGLPKKCFANRFFEWG